jgi:asparagine synthase (glutamine-hydrolysing)
VDACRIRLRSDVPIATCLSGGVDSSSVAAVIHRGLPLKDDRTATDFHRVFCAAFPGTMLDETHEAKSLARALGADLTVCEITPPSPDRLMEAISSCDGPMHALAFYPIWELYGKIAEAGIKVTMDGQGPDEMLGGYIWTVQSGLRAALLQGNLRWFRDLLWTYSGLGESPYFSSEAFVRANLLDLVKSPLSKLKRFILSRTFQDVKSSGPDLVFANPMPLGLDPLEQELYRQFCQAQLPTILQQCDRCSMAHGVESRMPFMDYRIVEFVFSLPNESLVGGGFTKRILRKAVDGLVPDATRLNKVKIGFNAPIVEWYAGPLRELMLDTMRSAEFRQSMYCEGDAWSIVFEQWLRNPRWNGAWGFWAPVHFILWKHQMSTSRHLFSPTAPAA